MNQSILATLAHKAMLEGRSFETVRDEYIEKTVRKQGSINCKGTEKDGPCKSGKNGKARIISASKKQCLECYQKDTFMVKHYNVMDQKGMERKRD